MAGIDHAVDHGDKHAAPPGDGMGLRQMHLGQRILGRIGHGLRCSTLLQRIEIVRLRAEDAMWREEFDRMSLTTSAMKDLP